MDTTNKAQEISRNSLLSQLPIVIKIKSGKELAKKVFFAMAIFLFEMSLTI